jgi:hypothetical protein
MWDSGVCHGAGFRDPAGNPILLHHRYAPMGRADALAVYRGLRLGQCSGMSPERRCAG